MSIFSKPPVTYVGWVPAEIGSVKFLRQFGFTGKMIEKNYPGLHGKVIEYVSASPEVMERACKEIRGFNWRSFTGIDEDGKQVSNQVYGRRPYPNE